MAGHGRDLDLNNGRDIILGGGPGGLPAFDIDPVLANFWSAFPCPPPWNTALLFRVNWTACVGQAVGQRLQWFLADRCNIPIDGSRLLPGGDGEGPAEGGGQEELEAPEACAVPCIIMIALACLVFSLLVAGVVFCVCRKRPKHSSPTHQTALTSHPDQAKYYTSCHYASAPVMGRPLETSLRGGRAETHVLNGACIHNSPYHQQHEHRLLLQHAHAHGHGSLDPLTPLIVAGQASTSGSVRQGELPVPPGARCVLTYRRLDGNYTSSSASQTNSERSHIYESIHSEGPYDSIKNGSIAGSVYAPGCGDPRLVNGDPRLATPVDADFCECECAAHLDFDVPVQLEGYYSDRSTQTQTLPIRHLRHVVSLGQDSPFSAPQPPFSFDIDDSASQAARPDSRLSNRSRRRTSSGSHYSDRSFGYREGGKRSIPALHPNYFDPPDPEPPEPVQFT